MLTSYLGGISFFSPQKGFVCDNVLNFEVVLASGKIVNANAKENKDLWVALRGGTNNFGIVTRFDLIAFEQGPFLGGQIIYDYSTREQQLDNFVAFSSNPQYDKYATIIHVYGYSGGQFATLNSLQYTKPVLDPPVFRPFTSTQPQFLNNLRISTHGDKALNSRGAVNIGLRYVVALS